MYKSTPEVFEISIKELALFTSKCRTTVSKMVKEMRIELNKQNHQIITLAEFCDFYDYPRKTACEYFNLHYHPHNDPKNKDVARS